VELEVLGFDHAELGEYVASRWRLPEHLTTAIRHHHAADEYDGPHGQMLYAVTLANLFCHAKGRSPLGLSDTRMPPSELFPGLGLEKPHVARIWEQLDAVLEAADLINLLDAP
jgi:HD-like signal output (HDOD) protein